MLDIKKYKAYMDLHQTKKNLKEELSNIEKEIAMFENNLIDDLLDNDMNKLSIGGKTVYINSQTWAKISDKDRAIEVLQNEGYGDYVKPSYSNAQVSRLLRDLEKNEEDIPSSFKGVIDPIVKQSLKVIKSN